MAYVGNYQVPDAMSKDIIFIGIWTIDSAGYTEEYNLFKDTA